MCSNITYCRGSRNLGRFFLSCMSLFLPLFSVMLMPISYCCKLLSMRSFHLHLGLPIGHISSGVAPHTSNSLGPCCVLNTWPFQLILHVFFVVDIMSGSWCSSLNSLFFLILCTPSSCTGSNILFSTLIRNHEENVQSPPNIWNYFHKLLIGLLFPHSCSCSIFHLVRNELSLFFFLIQV